MLKVEAGRLMRLAGYRPNLNKRSNEVRRHRVYGGLHGNPRHIGGDLDNFILESNPNLASVSSRTSAMAYKLSWTSDVPGKRKVHVKINQEDIVNSPTQITFQSTIPVLENSEIIFPDHEIPHVVKQRAESRFARRSIENAASRQMSTKRRSGM